MKTYKGNVSQRIKVKVYVPSESAKEIAGDLEYELFSDPRFDVDVRINKYSIEYEVTETGHYESEPQVLYTSNGDGYPGSYEDDLMTEEDIRDILQEYIDDNPEWEIEIGDISLKYDD